MSAEIDAAGVRTPRSPAARRVPLGALATRLSWGLVDQAVSSLTNFAVGFVVARSLGAVEFGVFALAWAAYTGVLNLSRGLASDPFVIRFNGTSPERWRAALRKATGTALVVGIVLGCVGVGGGLAVGGDVGHAFAAVGAIMPALLVQDAWRYGFFAAGRGRDACLTDVVWAAALVPGILLALIHPGVVVFLVAWGASAGVSALYGCVRARALPRPTSVMPWLREQRDLGFRYVIENVSNSGAGQVRTFGLGVITGLVAVGSVRGAELLLGPFLAVLMGLSLVAVPEAARIANANRARLPAFCLALGGVQAVAALTWGLGVYFLLPDSIGFRLLGEVWPAASTLILPATLTAAFAGLDSGASTGLRALGAARRSLRAQLVTSTAYITCALVGAALAGAYGASWGTALGCALGLAIWWPQLWAEVHSRDAGRPSGGRHRVGAVE